MVLTNSKLMITENKASRNEIKDWIYLSSYDVAVREVLWEKLDDILTDARSGSVEGLSSIISGLSIRECIMLDVYMLSFAKEYELQANNRSSQDSLKDITLFKSIHHAISLKRKKLAK